MKIANLATAKGVLAKVLTVGLLAGAVAMVAPAKAQAQQVYFQGGYGYTQEGYYAHERAEECRRREEFERRQAWLREQAFRHEEHERWEHRRFDRDRFDRFDHFDHDRYDRDRFDRDRFDRLGYR